MRQAVNRLVEWLGTTVVRLLTFVRQVMQPPRSAARLPAAFRALFNEVVASLTKQVYILPQTAALWTSVVLHRLQVLIPSLPYRESATESMGKYSLRQWVSNPVLKLSGRLGLVYNYWLVNKYYHWLTDALFRLLLLWEVSPDCELLPAALPEHMLITTKVPGFSRFQFINKSAFARINLIMPGHTAPVGRQYQASLLEVRRRVFDALAVHLPAAASRRVHRETSKNAAAC